MSSFSGGVTGRKLRKLSIKRCTTLVLKRTARSASAAFGPLVLINEYPTFSSRCDLLDMAEHHGPPIDILIVGFGAVGIPCQFYLG
jgi:hypothetical protein